MRSFIMTRISSFSVDIFHMFLNLFNVKRVQSTSQTKHNRSPKTKHYSRLTYRNFFFFLRIVLILTFYRQYIVQPFVNIQQLKNIMIRKRQKYYQGELAIVLSILSTTIFPSINAYFKLDSSSTFSCIFINISHIFATPSQEYDKSISTYFLQCNRQRQS